jgi:Pyruvate formate lyase-like
VLLALEGVSAHCQAYAELARELAERPDPVERENLAAVAQRMDRLATQPPATMLEAAQLVFTLHACLHLVGEPTAVGRLDQIPDRLDHVKVGQGAGSVSFDLTFQSPCHLDGISASPVETPRVRRTRDAARLRGCANDAKETPRV